MTKKPIVKRPRNPAHEYIVLVGAPSNLFNGFYHLDFANRKVVPEAAPVDASEPEIRKYVRGTAGHPDSHREHTTTHDFYWANFIYSAVKLVESGVVRPGHGDILTFIIHVPPYLLRQSRDWDASPYNYLLHGRKHWTGTAKPYDRSLRADEQGSLGSTPLPHTSDEPAVPQAPPSRSEPDINHQILMWTVAEHPIDGGFHKRAIDVFAYEKAIADIPRRLIRGSKFGTFPPVTRTVPPLLGVHIKLLLMTEPSQLYDYLKLGTWPDGHEWPHWEDIYDEAHAGDMRRMSECTWGAYELRHPKYRYRNWDPAPSVNRSRVKIKRFDYFGHSGGGRTATEEAFWLQYGWTNAKGEHSKRETFISTSDLEPHLSRGIFAKDSFAQLWGCNLGRFMGPMFARYMDKVVACPGLTSFNDILKDGVSLPRPDDPSIPFKTFVRS